MKNGRAMVPGVLVTLACVLGCSGEKAQDDEATVPVVEVRDFKVTAERDTLKLLPTEAFHGRGTIVLRGEEFASRTVVLYGFVKREWPPDDPQENETWYIIRDGTGVVETYDFRMTKGNSTPKYSWTFSGYADLHVVKGAAESAGGP